MARAFSSASILVGSLIALGSIAGCSSTPQSCPPGQMWDEASGQCFGQQPMCAQGQMWNGSMCVASGAACPAGQAWNGSTCVASATPACPPGSSWNGSACAPAIMGGGSSCSPAQAIDPAGAAVVTQGFTVLAQQNVPPGAKPVGPALAGNFQAGQCLEASIMLNPGKCYTVVAAGAGPSEVDVQIVPQLPGPLAQPIAQDNTSGPIAVLGKAPDCFAWVFPTAVPMKLVLKVPAGQGVVAAQLYER